MDTVFENQPNAGKLISSLRNTGYDSYTAIEDIIDNSIDAHARDIYVNAEIVQSDFRIMIADNWFWMSREVLDQALRLWSISDKSEVSDLGKFGMGLCTASISMSKRLEVITKQKDWKCLYSCQDLDDIVEKDAFIKILRDANSAEESVLNEITNNSDSGTLIVLTKIDRLSDKNMSQFATTLGKEIGRIFRKFIESGINIYINSKKVEPIDPLMIDDKETLVYSDESYELPVSATDGKRESIRVKIAILPDFAKEKSKNLKNLPINQKNQWFYIVRNNREIDKGVTLGVFERHNSTNRVRVELQFNATLDDAFWVNFSKDWIRPNQGIMDFIKENIWWQISSIKRILERKQMNSDPNFQIDHSDSEDVIAQKAKLLITPDAKIEKRASKTQKDEDKKTDENLEPAYERKNFREIKTSPQWMWARFEAASMGREWVLYECQQEGKIIVIRWNTDHPFYERMLLENKENKNITSWIDYLIFSLAAAELKSANDDNYELLSNLKSIMSSNLRSLFS